MTKEQSAFASQGVLLERFWIDFWILHWVIFTIWQNHKSEKQFQKNLTSLQKLSIKMNQIDL